MRLAGCLLLYVFAAICGGCDRSSPDAGKGASGPDAAFVRRCEALPLAPVTVVAAPMRVTIDDSRTQQELTGMFERSRPGHQTLGLTQTRPGYQMALRMSGLKDGSGRRTCTRAAIHVALTMNPAVVYIARELAADACRDAEVRQHEAQHVAVYEAHLAESAAQLARELPAAVGTRIVYADTVADAQARFSGELAGVLDAFLATQGERLRERQQEVDSPAEYARVAAACPAARYRRRPMGCPVHPIVVQSVPGLTQ